MKKSEHPAEAAEFAAWLNTDPEAVEAPDQHLERLPGLDRRQTAPALDEPPSFLPDDSRLLRARRRDLQDRPRVHLGAERQRHLPVLQATRSARRSAAKQPFSGGARHDAADDRQDMEKRASRSSESARREAGAAAPYLFLLPGGGAVHRCSSPAGRLRDLAEPARARRSRAGFIGAAGRGVRRARRTTATRSPTPSSSTAWCGSRSTAAIVVPVMLGLALLFALLLDSPGGPLRPRLAARDLPALRGARRDRDAAVGLPVPARA